MRVAGLGLMARVTAQSGGMGGVRLVAAQEVVVGRTHALWRLERTTYNERAVPAGATIPSFDSPRALA